MLPFFLFISIEVLIDPYKRAIYDSVGVKGLEQNELQLVVRSKTPQEIREDYERLSREREERRLEKLTNSEVCYFHSILIFELSKKKTRMYSD